MPHSRWLRQVLAYRRLGFGLREIAALVGDPSADAVAHLRRLRGLLLEQRDRADAMAATIDRELEARHSRLCRQRVGTGMADGAG
jgi:DNA-binding transcriptional MerR regulator